MTRTCTRTHAPLDSRAKLDIELPIICSARLWDLTCRVTQRPTVASGPNYLPSPGFLQVCSDTKLVAVPGPVPSLPHCCKEACELPAAFTSEATHFKPIVLAQDTGVAR